MPRPDHRPVGSADPAAILAEIRQHQAASDRHRAAVDHLLDELLIAAQIAAAPVERHVSLAEAAHEVNWSEARLRRFIIRYDDADPSRLPLAVQPGGMKNGRWMVYIDRLRGAIEDRAPMLLDF